MDKSTQIGSMNVLVVHTKSDEYEITITSEDDSHDTTFMPLMTKTQLYHLAVFLFDVHTTLD